MNNGSDGMCDKYPRKKQSITHIALVKVDAIRMIHKIPQIIQNLNLAIIEIVHNDNLVSFLHQTHTCVAADESQSSCE
jgi:hypothetical protein